MTEKTEYGNKNLSEHYVQTYVEPDHRDIVKRIFEFAMKHRETNGVAHMWWRQIHNHEADPDEFLKTIVILRDARRLWQEDLDQVAKDFPEWFKQEGENNAES